MSKLETYMFSYHYDGSKYGVNIPAYSLKEAEGRFSSMSSGSYDGVLQGTIPALLPASGIIVRLYCWMKNFTKGG